MFRSILLLATAVAALLSLVSASASAEAVTYRGTLGDLPVVVELSAPLEDARLPFAGRYFYRDQGVDIPLQSLAVTPGRVDLLEESPCPAEACQEPLDDPAQATAAARWELLGAGDRLTGTWDREQGPPLVIELQRVGTRELPPDFDGTPMALAAVVDEIYIGNVGLSDASSPYDLLKVDVPMTAGPEFAWGPVAFRYVTDPRTNIEFPRLTRLPGGDPDVANRALAQRHWQMSLAGLQCRSRQYRGMNYAGMVPWDAGSLAGYDEEQVTVTYLSPQLVSWTETGSLFCGGAHPYNHHLSFTLDLATGEPLDLSRIFAAWVPHIWGDSETVVTPDVARASPADYAWGPDTALADFVRGEVLRADPAFAEECEVSNLIGEHLRLSFAGDDHVVFSLEGLPHVISACEGALFDVPIAQLQPFLTPDAGRYFPGLPGPA